MLSIPTKRHTCPTREIKEMTPNKHPFLVSRPITIVTPQYHTESLKEGLGGRSVTVDQSKEKEGKLFG
jgi:hypothetical protein